jgi:hypothetical protein
MASIISGGRRCDAAAVPVETLLYQCLHMANAG